MELHTEITPGKASQVPSTPPVSAPVKKNGKKILVVEDEKPLSKVMFLKLTKMGFDVATAFDGEEAIAKLNAYTPDLMVLDLVMPKVGGFDVLEYLKSKNKKIPAIVVSNLGQPEDEKKARNLGAIQFFIKSNTPIKELVDFIKSYLKV